MTTKIFVGNLSWHTDERTLKNVFASAGPVKFVKVIRDRTTTISKGFAFVTFKEPEAVKIAVEQFNDYVVDGKPIQVTVAEEKKPSSSSSSPAGEGAPAPTGGGAAAAEGSSPAGEAAPEDKPSTEEG